MASGLYWLAVVFRGLWYGVTRWAFSAARARAAASWLANVDRLAVGAGLGAMVGCGNMRIELRPTTSSRIGCRRIFGGRWWFAPVPSVPLASAIGLGTPIALRPARRGQNTSASKGAHHWRRAETNG